MDTTIDIKEAEYRLELAKKILGDYTRNTRDIGAIEIADYTIVDDGQDRWIAATDSYNDAVEAIVRNVLLGKYSDDPDDEAELMCMLYSDFCVEVDCIYSRAGTPNDLDALSDLDVTHEQLLDILDALAIEQEELETSA